MDARSQADEFRRVFGVLSTEISRLIVGHERTIEQILICLFTGGHALLEGVPGLGKTRMVQTLGRCLDLDLARIQFTPDLMPADVIGTNVISDASGARAFRFERGPIFGAILLADEINRATPKTQSALLEAMQEHAVTVGGVRHRLPEPFFVLATQNPIEIEGTYVLPEAQVDRFMLKLAADFPGEAEIVEIIERTTGLEEPAPAPVVDVGQIDALKGFVRDVPVPTEVKRHVARLILATHPESSSAPEPVKRFIRYGASPRGAQALVLGGKVKALLAGRFNVSHRDVREVALPALRHRLILNFEGEAEGMSTDAIVEAVLGAIEPADG